MVKKQNDFQFKIARHFSGKVSSHGMYASLNMNNPLNSDDAGVVVSINGNQDEIVYLGEIR
ncbi:MAG TPA: hypothetical protein ACFYD6_00530 [Candidatus Brocadiia bacterium]|nr:hypothetical protein [Planctomycetota bacterium]MBI4008423.1 hypothetical protein [Planctomycetota bacterium]MDO8094080.1 hypothetical protein [Candidatus Brocadiales bacterium]